MSFGKPVVSSKVGGVTEILDGNNGFAVDNKEENFQKAIDNILAYEEKYLAFSTNARKTYEEKFTLEVMTSGYDKLYNEI